MPGTRNSHAGAVGVKLPLPVRKKCSIRIPGCGLLHSLSAVRLVEYRLSALLVDEQYLDEKLAKAQLFSARFNCVGSLRYTRHQLVQTARAT